MNRTFVLGLAAAATLFGATAAQAARVDWSVGINLPPIGVVARPGDVGYPAYAPPLVYSPRPRLVEPAPVYLPRPRLWLPPLPPLPAFFGHDRWHQDGHDWGRDGPDHGGRDGRDHDRDGHVSWRR